MSDTDPSPTQLLEITTEIVSSHISNNPVAAADLPQVIAAVHAKLATLGRPVEQVRDPAVPVKKSIRKDSLVCLECGRSMKMLKRHLGTEHGMTPQEYRAKWRLPADYPMITPDYASKRQEIAKESGLGRGRGKRKRAAKRSG